MSAGTERPLASAAWLHAPASRRLLEALRARGRPARFVGGCVRDALLGRDLAGQELDLATPELPNDVQQLLKDAGIRAIPTGLDHGTVTAVIGKRRFEITTLRRDVSTDGRRATVAFTDDFREDAARRDLTINAMSCDAEGRLFDYFDGRADLAAGRIRFVGDAVLRIAEDYLRILRFFRFFAHYGREPADASALQACAAAAGCIERLSGERIQAEMLRLLRAQDPLPALRLMAEAGVLEQVVSGPVALERLARLLRLAPGADALLRLAALLRPPPAEPGTAGWVAGRWRLSNAQSDRLMQLVETPLPPLAASPAERRRARYRMGKGLYLDLVCLAATEVEEGEASSGLPDAVAEAERWTPKRLPVTGDDVTALGLAPGPRVGEVLGALEAWWVDRDFRPGREDCLAELRRLLAQEGEASARAPTG
jgi:poly(A) polymerase